MKEYIVQAYSQETIDSFDAHNAPELVRCKDCKHWIPGEIDEMDNFTEPRCEWHGGGWSSHDYCSYAERREQDT